MKAVPPILALLAIVLLLLGGYVGAYLSMGERRDAYHWQSLHANTLPPPKWIERTYSTQLTADVFTPVAWMESRIRGIEVRSLYHDPEFD